MEQKKWVKQDLADFFRSLDGLDAAQSLAKVQGQIDWAALELPALLEYRSKLLVSEKHAYHLNWVAERILRSHIRSLEVRKGLCLAAIRRQERDEAWSRAILAIGGPDTLNFCIDFMKREKDEQRNSGRK